MQLILHFKWEFLKTFIFIFAYYHIEIWIFCNYSFFFRPFKKKIVLPSWKKFVTPFSFEWKLQGIIFPKWWKNVERRVGICFCVKNNFYYNVYTSSMIEWIKWKIKNSTMSEQFRNIIENLKKETKSKPLAHPYMIVHFPVLVQALQ